MPVVVAWVLQLAWEIVRSALGSAAFTARPITLSFAVTVATTLAAAAGFAQGARRLSGRRRAGAVIAVFAWSTRRRTTLIAAAASGICLVAWSSLAILGAAHLPRAAVFVVTNVTAALLYRSLRPAFRDDTPTARAL